MFAASSSGCRDDWSAQDTRINDCVKPTSGPMFAWTGRKAWQQVQERNSNRRDRLADLVKQAPGSVLIAPGMDVIPVDAVALHGDHVAGIVAVLGTMPKQAPAELGNDDVLSGWKPDLAVSRSDPAATTKSLPVVRVSTQHEEFDLELN